jgi:hypothetical protein
MQYIGDTGAVSVLWSIGVNFIAGHFSQPSSQSPDYDFFWRWHRSIPSRRSTKGV